MPKLTMWEGFAPRDWRSVYAMREVMACSGPKLGGRALKRDFGS